MAVLSGGDASPFGCDICLLHIQPHCVVQCDQVIMRNVNLSLQDQA
jgi:hypothetical protein